MEEGALPGRYWYPPRGLMRRVWESQKKPEYDGRVTDKDTQRPERRESLISSPSLLVSLSSPLLKTLKEPDNRRELFTESQSTGIPGENIEGWTGDESQKRNNE